MAPAPQVSASWPAAVLERYLWLLGVRVTDTTRPRALAMLEDMLRTRDGRCRSLFFVNAHTLNVACDEPDYRHVLNASDLVFNDGTGVRWATRQRGVQLYDNLNGSDLIPELFAAMAGRGYRYFLLGAAPDRIEASAAGARQRFPGWIQAGYHHGYVHGEGGEAVIDAINAARPDLLLVGMGNPIQERWIHRHRDRLQVPLAVGVGGLFDYWSGNRRAPAWIRRLGSEWVYILYRQPQKWQRYLLGNPKFLYRMRRWLKSDLAQMARREAPPAPHVAPRTGSALTVEANASAPR
jgi:N-acetylglucosaminyldiphosphoundecaprenol N-acetyl-beta-D-mannosaminyltransferase